jgi:membrane-bound lytic murein transglycosylase B
MKQLKLFIFLSLFPLLQLNAIDYTEVNETKRFINMMYEKFNYKKEYLYKLFKQVRKDPQVPHKTVKKIVKPLSEEYRPQGSWDIFSRVHLEHNQTELGVKFMAEHNKTLEKAYKEYGVPPEYITAIIGIESYYGKNRGLYYVFDSLTHLAFDAESKRKKFYQYQLQEFLRMCFREQVEPRRIKGSKSGAIGLAQFMPSNYKSLAVDFNNDGKIRISQPVDAIGSVANYFKKNGWKKGEPVGVRVAYKGNRFYGLKTGLKYKYERKYLPNIYPRETFNYNKKVMLIKLEKEKYDELWYATNNFYVITRYNHSDYYAMAVHQLAQKIKSNYNKKYNQKVKNMLYASNK